MKNTWLNPPESWSLESNELHVWRIHVPSFFEYLTMLEKLLSPDELSRANRFHFQIHHNRFIVARSFLRILLGKYMKILPQDISFNYMEHGKPEIHPKLNPEKIRFNLSHSKDWALLGVVKNINIGVDVEFMRENVEHLKLAGRFFSPQENATLRSLPESKQFEAFYLCWTRKEAFIKADGKGLSFPLKNFSVVFHPDLPPALESVAGDLQTAENWSMFNPDFPGNYKAAVAIEGKIGQMNCFEADRSLLDLG